MNQPDARRLPTRPAPAPDTIPVETLIQSMKRRRRLVIEGDSGALWRSKLFGSLVWSGGLGLPAPTTGPHREWCHYGHARRSGRADESDRWIVTKLQGRSALRERPRPIGAFRLPIRRARGACSHLELADSGPKSATKACWARGLAFPVKVCGLCPAKSVHTFSCGFLSIWSIWTQAQIKKVRSSGGTMAVSACSPRIPSSSFPLGTDSRDRPELNWRLAGIPPAESSLRFGCSERLN